jgi:hypothetical protein
VQDCFTFPKISFLIEAKAITVLCVRVMAGVAVVQRQSRTSIPATVYFVTGCITVCCDQLFSSFNFAGFSN